MTDARSLAVASSPAAALHPSRGAEARRRPIGPDAIAAIARGLATTASTIEPSAERGEVIRVRVLATEAYDAWVVELGPHSSIEPHDHDGSIGLLVVAGGHLVDFGLDPSGRRRARLRHLAPGDEVSVGHLDRHALVNPHPGEAVMVQVFSPPLGPTNTAEHDAP